MDVSLRKNLTSFSIIKKNFGSKSKTHICVMLEKAGVDMGHEVY